MAKRRMKVRLLVREVAIKKGMTRATLARRADLTYQTVHQIWEKPYRDVSFSSLVKIASALKCAVTDLYVIEPDDDE